MRHRLFLDHPASLGETYTEHFLAASRIGFTMLGAGLACLAHALVPATFETTASRTVRRLNANLESRRTPCPPSPPVL